MIYNKKEKESELIKEFSIRVPHLGNHELAVLHEVIDKDLLDDLFKNVGKENVIGIAAQALRQVKHTTHRMFILVILFGGVGEDVGVEFFESY